MLTPKKIVLLIIVAVVVFYVAGYTVKKRKLDWGVLPWGTLVDTPEEFQQKNTP